MALPQKAMSQKERFRKKIHNCVITSVLLHKSLSLLEIEQIWYTDNDETLLADALAKAECKDLHELVSQYPDDFRMIHGFNGIEIVPGPRPPQLIVSNVNLIRATQAPKKPNPYHPEKGILSKVVRMKMDRAKAVSKINQSNCLLPLPINSTGPSSARTATPEEVPLKSTNHPSLQSPQNISGSRETFFDNAYRTGRSESASSTVANGDKTEILKPADEQTTLVQLLQPIADKIATSSTQPSFISPRILTTPRSVTVPPQDMAKRRSFFVRRESLVKVELNMESTEAVPLSSPGSREIEIETPLATGSAVLSLKKLNETLSHTYRHGNHIASKTSGATTESSSDHPHVLVYVADKKTCSIGIQADVEVVDKTTLTDKVASNFIERLKFYHQRKVAVKN